MKEYQIRIFLESDLCVSDGNVYNSAIDTDVCYDTYGFPYLPAKRLKGVLRELGEELNDWGYGGDVNALFGRPGRQKGMLCMGNAYLENLDEYKAQVRAAGDSVLVHPQNVLSQFTYVRTQTALDPDSGAADKRSLRTVRVIHKGLVFVADVQLEAQNGEDISKHVKLLDDCCRIWKYLGLARTRGLGHISATLVSVETPTIEETEKYKKHAPWKDGSLCLEYEIYLKEPIVCKSVNGQEENSMDYIEGAKILGALVNRLKMEPESLTAFLGDDHLRCSNAYITYNGRRMSEVPASLYGLKNNDEVVCDKLCETREQQEDNEKYSLQWEPLSHCYIDYVNNQQICKKDVEREIRYHHRRPADKSIGRALETSDSVFYQISSIRAGQSFRGFVTAGTPELLKKIYECIVEDDALALGAGRRTEYGQAEWKVTGCFVPETKTVKTTDFAVRLEAPAIIYSDNAVYTTDRRILNHEVKALLKLDNSCIKAEQAYVNYTTVGGFQVTWGLRKPVLMAFDKGTVLHYKTCREVELPANGRIWIGERVTEGYGEASIVLMDNQPYQRRLLEAEEYKTKNDERESTSGLKVMDQELLREISHRLFLDYVRAEAARNACNDVKQYNWKQNKAAKPTVSNLLLICKECDNITHVSKTAKIRFGKKGALKNQKYNVWEKIYKNVTDQASKVLGQFCKAYQLEDYIWPEEALSIFYLREYLQQVKYALRDEKAEVNA